MTIRAYRTVLMEILLKGLDGKTNLFLVPYTIMFVIPEHLPFVDDTRILCMRI